ncbi:prepilin-type N-terminal cleavage/methylation domain-containing protein [Thiomicrospira microaerophila]|uniref:prepilin-type N-terminal cleavage/methylation domain-containing protein n=1 Tax=Thiomicrospira microaerophila TaxID=406020 RepID=UPI00200E7D7B|nr:prepilin-type N-terminal cleavage/methylation domain-containing protein [Thiomicrospira microaerophila]UQB41644.1 prepilin-type N-terminal cleavage/methylation domain-containing protein [Thiomicrospira microaerophila]
MKNHLRIRGFTLIEIALVIAIIGIIAAGIIASIGGVKDSQDFVADQQKLKDIKSALLEHVTREKHMPCPDTTGDGIENRVGAFCTATEGFLPHATLRTHAVNSFSQPFFYAVNRFANLEVIPQNALHSASYFTSAGACDPNETINQEDPPCFNLQTRPIQGQPGDGNFNICNERVQTCLNDTTELAARDIPAVVVSFGKNSQQTWGNAINGIPDCPSTLQAQERQNCRNLDGLFHQAQQSSNLNDFFDDSLIWVSSLEIKRQIPNLQLVLAEAPAGGEPETPDPETPTPEDPPPPFGLDPFPDIKPNNYNSIQDCSGLLGCLLGFLVNTVDFLIGTSLSSILPSSWQNTDSAKINGQTDNNSNHIMVRGDLNSATSGPFWNRVTIDTNLQEGNNSLVILRDLNSNVFSGSGNDYYHIERNLNANITAAGGNNEVYVKGNVINNPTIQTGNGSDLVFINGNLDGQIITGGGDDEVRIYGTLSNRASINGGSGNNTLYLNMPQEDYSTVESQISNFNRIYFNDGTSIIN